MKKIFNNASNSSATYGKSYEILATKTKNNQELYKVTGDDGELVWLFASRFKDSLGFSKENILSILIGDGTDETYNPSDLAAAIENAVEVLKEVRTGTDFEVEAWNAAAKLKEALGLQEMGNEFGVNW